MFYKLKTVLKCFSKEKYVFFDLNDSSLALAKNIAKNKQRIVLFVLDKQLADNSVKQKIKTIGARYFVQWFNYHSLICNQLLKKVLLKNKTYLFFFSGLDVVNLKSVSKFYDSWTNDEYEKVRSCFELIVRTQNKLTHSVIENYVNNAPFKVPYSLFNDAELIAAEVVKQFPPIDTLTINTQNAKIIDTYETLIIGFDETGEAILRKLIEATQFVGTQFKATVVINETNECAKHYFVNYPEIKNHFNVSFLNIDAQSNKFYEWLNQQNTIKQIMVSAGSDKENIFIASEVSISLSNRNISYIPVIVIARDNEASFWKLRNWPFLHFVGMNETIFTERKVLKADYLYKAKAIHQFYNQLKPFAQRIAWEQLSDIKKETNIAIAESLYAKLKLMGKTFEEVKQMSEMEFQLFLQAQPERLLNLAIAEHLRWNATYFTNGWKTWHLKEIPEDSPHQNEKQKLHACLVDWNALKEVEKRFNIPFQFNDFNNVLITRILISNYFPEV
ncbi:MAG: hypothetical protein FWC41_07145 [Firmicutes bacterium]|nr:hypothetical protein [Bacillota bacterium]